MNKGTVDSGAKSHCSPLSLDDLEKYSAFAQSINVTTDEAYRLLAWLQHSSSSINNNQ